MHTTNTIKGHGFKVGDTVHFYGMGRDEAHEAVPMLVTKLDNGYMLVSTTDEKVTVSFGATAKIHASFLDVADVVHVTIHAATDGTLIYRAKCSHGWETGFHTTPDDATDVARGHGTVSRPLYEPMATDGSGRTVARYRADLDIHDGMYRSAMDLLFNLGVIDTRRTCIAENAWRTTLTLEPGFYYTTQFNDAYGRVLREYVSRELTGRKVWRGDRAWTVEYVNDHVVMLVKDGTGDELELSRASFERQVKEGKITRDLPVIAPEVTEPFRTSRKVKSTSRARRFRKGA